MVTITNILLELDAGVIDAERVLDAVTYELDVVLLSVESVAVTTCNTAPADTAVAKVLSPLRNVVESLVPVAVNLAKDTVLSEGVPMFNTSPNTIMKSITSDVVSADENTIVEPDIV